MRVLVTLATGVVGVMPLRAETIDRVLAVVHGRLIMLSDVTAARDLGLQTPSGARSPSDAADAVRDILSKLIDRELVLNEVDRYAPPDPPPEAIDRQLAAVRARFASQQAFETALSRSGIDEKQVREMLRQDLRIRAYEDQRFTPADPRRQALIDAWLNGLRRRGDVIDLYLSGR